MRKETLNWVEKGTAWEPYSYQKQATKFLVEHACAALFLDPG